MAQLSIKGLVKEYEAGVQVVKGIDLDIDDEEFVVLVGPSGCGKSTTLRMIAGLEDVSDGEISIGGRRVDHLAPRDRDIAMVFQNYALYPHMSVFDNMGFGLKVRKFARPVIEERVKNAAGILDIASLLDRKPRALSGGQRQRVAMGRAMVRDPSVFLFDEPLSNLDAKLRVRMRTEIKALHQRLRTTSVYVTHDQVEAMTLADRVVVMNQGRIEQIGGPQELYRNPATRFVAEFIGSPAMNLIPVVVEKENDSLRLRADETRFTVPEPRRDRYRPYLNRQMLFGIRPEHISDTSKGAYDLAVEATIRVVEPMGMDTLVHFSIGGASACARVSPDIQARPTEAMTLHFSMDHMHLMEAETGRVL